MVHQRLEWFRDRSKNAHRHVCELHSLSLVQSSSATAVNAAATIRPRAPVTPLTSGSRRALPSDPNRARSLLADAASFSVATSTG